MPTTDRRSFLRIGLALAAIPSTTILNLRYLRAQDNALLSIDRPPDNSSRVSDNKAGATDKGGYNMKLSLNDVDEEDRGLLSPCGIICGGCDIYTNESVEAAKTIVQIWEGFNLADAAMIAGLTSQEILTIISNLRKFIKHREGTITCSGCNTSGGLLKRCPIRNCVTSKGYWTCAECEEYNLDSESPCPHPETDYPDVPLSSKGEMSHLVCKRYKSNNVENLKTCREIGYPDFIKEAKEKLGKGWRTWQVISNEMVFTKSLVKKSTRNV